MTAALEAELAHNIKNLGYEVMGSHPKQKLFDKYLFDEIWNKLRNDLLK
jgi:hypothetical protein